MNKILRLKSLDLRQLEDWAIQVASVMTPGDVVLLQGDVGTGKTTFAQRVIRSLSAGADVTSPTYTLAHPYTAQFHSGELGCIWHIDLYRTQSVEEVLLMGIEEMLQQGALIEWPERLGHLQPHEALTIHLECTDSPTQRDVSMHATDSWQARMKLIDMSSVM